MILTPADVDYSPEDVALDVARGIEELRALIAEGEDESGDAEWNLEEIVRNARAEFDAERGD